MLRECQNEGSVDDGLQLSPAVDSLNVTRHTRICSIHFEGGLGPTKLNPVPPIVESSEWKHHEKTSRSKKGSKQEEYSAFEGANTPYWQSVYVDAEVQTDLTSSEIEVSSMASS